MRSFVALVAVTAVTACGTPPLKVDLAVATAMAGNCAGAESCADIKIPCDPVASIRILDPSDPTAPFISQCVPVPLDNKSDLCSLAKIDLLQTPLPEQTLEVQVVVYAADQLPIDPEGNPVCPTERDGLSFGASDGFAHGSIVMDNPLDVAKPLHPVPAIGGRAFYHPGDASTLVTLGCNDLGVLSTCQAGQTTMVTATVVDFDNRQTLLGPFANQISVAIGEPRPTTDATGTHYQLTSGDLHVLPRTVDTTANSAWGGLVDTQFVQSACLDVLQDGAATTATLTCKPAMPGRTIDITGDRLVKESLQDFLPALGNPSLDHGLVVGIVLSEIGVPAGGYKISTSNPAMIEYLSADRTSVGGTMTAPGGGIFISRDAPFGTTFTTGTTGNTITGYGGLVDGKVTIVVLQFGKSPIGQ